MPPPSVPIENLRAPTKRAFPDSSDPELSAEKQALRLAYIAARDAFNRKDYAAARALFTPLVDQYPSMHDYVLRDLGRSILAGSEDGGMSKETAELLIQLADGLLTESCSSSQDGWGYYLRARALHSLGRLEEAETDYSKALARNLGPSKDVIYYYLGNVCEDLGRPGDAYVHYVFASQTGFGSYRARASEAAGRVGVDLDPAERGIDWVLRRDELARLIKKGADREVLRLIQEARKECSDEAIKGDLRRLEGFCYLKLGRHDEAERLLVSLMDEEVTGGRPNWETIEALQKQLGKNGDNSGRMALLTRFVASHPKEEGIEAYFILASLLRDEGRQAEAEALIEEVFKRYPDQPSAHEAQWLLAWARIRRGEHSEALEALKALAEKVPAQTEGESRARYWLARMLVLTGDSEGGTAIFKDVHQRFPDSYYGAMAGWRLNGLPQVRFEPLEIAPAPQMPMLGDEPAELGRNLLFPGWAEHLARVKDAGSAAHLEKAKELWLMGNTREGYFEIDAAVAHDSALPQARWMGAALAHAMGGMLSGIRHGHRYLSSNISREELLPERQALAFPMPYREGIVRHALARGIEPALVAALIQQESTFRADIGSPVGAKGLMQIMPYTGTEIAGWLDIRNYQHKYLTVADFNLRLGTEYMRAMLAKFDGSLVRTLASYNAGPNAVARWVRRFGDLEDDYLAEEIPYKETRHYVRAVLRNFQGYLNAYGSRVAYVPAAGAEPAKLAATAGDSSAGTVSPERGSPTGGREAVHGRPVNLDQAPGTMVSSEEGSSPEGEREAGSLGEGDGERPRGAVEKPAEATGAGTRSEAPSKPANRLVPVEDDSAGLTSTR